MRYYLNGLLLSTAIVVCSSLVAVADDLENDLHGLNDAQVDTTVEFSLNNGIFFVLHELGHMLISEFDLPVLGKEEDAADMLSTLILLEAEDETFDKVLEDSVAGWKLSADLGEEPELWATHSLDRQRAYNMLCMMVGKNPERFASVADELDMPAERREECQPEYAKSYNSWFGVLGDYTRDDEETTKFQIKYNTPESNNLLGYAEMVEASNLLEIIEVIANAFKLDDGIKLTTAECEDSNAYWSSDDRELTYCYELAQWFIKNKADLLREQASERPKRRRNG